MQKTRKITRAMTLVEMLVAMAVIVVLFVTIVPQIRSVQNSWASKRANAEVIQNGRALIDHITFNLMQAKNITAVSDSNQTSGYIEFLDYNNVTFKYEIGDNNYVMFGQPGNLSVLAGPVSSMQFAGYNAYDLDTPIADVNKIRCVRAQAVLTNQGRLTKNRTFTTTAYIRTNTGAGENPVLSISGEPVEFDCRAGIMPALEQIDRDNYICAYEGPGDLGRAVVLTVDTNAGTVRGWTRFDFETEKAAAPDLSKIDAAHYLCTYQGDADKGFAVVLTVTSPTWIISKQTLFEFDSQSGKVPALCRIDATNHLCAYQGDGEKGCAVVLTVSLADWTISKGAVFEFDSQRGKSPALCKIDDNHYLCAYRGDGDKGWAVVLNVSGSTITKNTAFLFDDSGAENPTLCRMDAGRYMCAYTSGSHKGEICTLIVDSGTWTISRGPVSQFDRTQGENPALARAYNGTYLCTYKNRGNKGCSILFTVDPDNYSISGGATLQFDMHNIDIWPDMYPIDDVYVFCTYTGWGDAGMAVIFNVGPPVLP